MEAKNIYNLIILDESGSMTAIEHQAVSAMNKTIQGVRIAQKANPEQNYFISLVVFEGDGPEGVRTVRDRVPVESIEDICRMANSPIFLCTCRIHFQTVSVCNINGTICIFIVFFMKKLLFLWELFITQDVYNHTYQQQLYY